MNSDLLLSWMSHVGEGSWAMFRNTVRELAGRDVDLPALCRKLKIGLSDLGFADFFIEDSQRWRMLPPILGGLATKDGAILCGSRTPIFVGSLRASAAVHGCEFRTEELDDCPTLIHIFGEMEQLTKIADEIEAFYEPRLSAILAQGLIPIQDSLNGAPQESVPLNWKARSFEFGTCTWTDGLLPNSACEYIPSHGLSKYFVRLKRGKLLRFSKREAIYAAAMLNGVRLIEYDGAAKCLKVPLFAPLPDLYSRVACLCSGRPAEVADGQIRYGGVPPELAAILMVAVGQPHPKTKFLTETRRIMK